MEKWRSDCISIVVTPFERLPMAGRVPAGRMHVPRGHGASGG